MNDSQKRTLQMINQINDKLDKLEDVISCQNCVYRHLQKTPESRCYSQEDELQFSFCNYQKEK